MHAWINITHPGFSDAETVITDNDDEWISWEYMVASLRAKGEAEGRVALLARKVVELRGEVAKLKPLEAILAKGGDPVQHLSEAVLDLSAKVRGMEEASRLDQSEILRLTRCVAELQANLIAVVEPPAVVVPEWDEEAFASAHATPPNPSFEYSAAMRAAKAGYKFAASRLRTIPADRVPGEWKTPADHPEWPKPEREGGLTIGSDVSVRVLGWIEYWGWHSVVLREDDDTEPSRYFWEDPMDCFTPKELSERLRGWIPMPPEPNALRADQGGAAT